MHRAELYKESNSFQLKETLLVFEDYLPKLKWSQETEKVLDVGCGTGDVTAGVLNDEVQKRTNGRSAIVGTDMSQKMVDFAKEK